MKISEKKTVSSKAIFLCLLKYICKVERYEMTYDSLYAPF